MMTTMERINELTAERAGLYRGTGVGRRGGSAVRERARLIDQELEQLWEQRRRERVGQLEGIDLLVDLEYRRVYGTGFEEVVRPAAVGEPEPEDEAVLAA